MTKAPVQVAVDGLALAGSLALPSAARGIVAFAHGSGSSRLSPRNTYVASVLGEAGLATLLFDLLTPAEEVAERETRHLRFDIPLLAARLQAATDWLQRHPDTAGLPVGYFGASTGAAAALIAAAARAEAVQAVVSRGGRPDLALPVLAQVRTPTLLIVGERDTPVLRMNEEALAHLAGVKQLVLVPGATHLFEEPGALEQVARLARDWFLMHLTGKQEAATKFA